MSVPPSDPRRRPVPDDPSWRGLFASYLLIPAVPLFLWVLADPLGRTAALAGAAGVLVGLRHATRVARCLQVCGEFTVDLVGGITVTVTRGPADEPA